MNPLNTPEVERVYNPFEIVDLGEVFDEDWEVDDPIFHSEIEDDDEENEDIGW